MPPKSKRGPKAKKGPKLPKPKDVAAKADEKCSGIREWLWQVVSVCVYFYCVAWRVGFGVTHSVEAICGRATGAARLRDVSTDLQNAYVKTNPPEDTVELFRKFLASFS